MRWASNKKYEGLEDACKFAAENGHVGVLKWALDMGFLLSGKVFQPIVEKGDVSVLPLLVHNNVFITANMQYSVYEWAGRSGKVETIDWIYEHLHIPINVDVIHSGAASGGHLNILQWAIDINHPPNEKQLFIYALSAVRSGHIHVLEKLEGLEDFEHTMQHGLVRSAAELGHLDILQLLVKKFQLTSYEVCRTAADYAQLEILWWYMSKKDCEWDPHKYMWTFSGMDETQNMKLMTWIKKNNFEIDPKNGVFLVYCAIRRGHIKLAEWIKENMHFSWNKGDNMMICNNMRVVKWQLLQGFNVNYHVVAVEAAKKGDLALFRFVLYVLIYQNYYVKLQF